MDFKNQRYYVDNLKAPRIMITIVHAGVQGSKRGITFKGMIY